MAMVDAGIERVTALLDDDGDGHHYAIKGIGRLRLSPGSHSAWAASKPIMFYKVIEAAKRCGLEVTHFDIGQKSMCVLPPLALRPPSPPPSPNPAPPAPPARPRPPPQRPLGAPPTPNPQPPLLRTQR